MYMMTGLAVLYHVPSSFSSSLFILSLTFYPPLPSPSALRLCSATIESSLDYTAAIIGGVVVVVLIIAITVAVVSIAALFLKNRHGDSSIGE